MHSEIREKESIMRLREIGKLIGILCGIIAILLLIMWWAGLFGFLEKHSGTFLVIFTGVVAFSTVLYAVLTSNLVSENKRMREDQIRSLIIAFLAELIYNFRRCVLYHEQLYVGGLATKSSLYELTDAGALSNLANVVDNPEVISTIVELKSHYYQIKRHTDIIASQIAERDRIISRIALLKKVIGRAGGPVKKAFAEEEVERLSSEEGSLEKAIVDAQRTAEAFFEYKKVANYIGVILNEAKKLMPERQVIAQYEKEFRNNCSAMDFIDEKRNEMSELDPEKLDRWRENIEKEFNRIRNEGL